jgi:glycosyltransferase involved in cell wall biosynthesis
MHVAYIHQHFATKGGSTGTRSYEMSQRLIAAGHRVTMICGAYDGSDLARPNTDRVTTQEIDGIRVICVAEPYSNKMSFARRVLAFGRFARAAGRIVGGLDADLVFATSTPLTVGLPGMKGARRLGVPFVFEVRDLWPELVIAMDVVKNPFMIWYLRRMERKIYFAAERIIALAPGIKDGICATGYPADRVAMVPNSSDLDLFKPSDDELNDSRFGPPGDFRLVFTGAHGAANGLDAVLDAAVELKRRGESGIRFVFIGKGGQRDRLIERCRAEGLDSMMSWVESIRKEELAGVLPRMDVGMMILKNVPAFYYGTSPNKFFDYIASGLPVLNNYPGWLAGMIAEKKCGAVVPPGNAKAFADAVVRLRDNPADCKEMGKRSRELAETEFSRDRMGELFVGTLEQARREFKRN